MAIRSGWGFAACITVVGSNGLVSGCGMPACPMPNGANARLTPSVSSSFAYAFGIASIGSPVSFALISRKRARASDSSGSTNVSPVAKTFHCPSPFSGEALNFFPVRQTVTASRAAKLLFYRAEHVNTLSCGRPNRQRISGAISGASWPISVNRCDTNTVRIPVAPLTLKLSNSVIFDHIWLPSTKPTVDRPVPQ